MREPVSGRTGHKPLLQKSAETRLQANRQKISLAFTLCNTVEIEIRYGHFAEAKDFLDKLHSIVDGVTLHINDPAHASDRHARQELRKQLSQLQKRLFALDSRLQQGH